MVRRLALLPVFMLVPLAAWGQQSFFIKGSIQASYMPGYQLNHDHLNNGSAIGLKLSIYNFNTLPVEVGVRYASGYHSSVAFSYGLSLAYIFFTQKSHWLKVGINGGKVKMAEYEYNIEVGKLIEDDFHEIIQPYIEWEWLFSKYISGFLQVGYRFLRSETRRVTGIISKTPKKTTYRATPAMGLYGSGLQISAGLKILLFSD